MKNRARLSCRAESFADITALMVVSTGILMTATATAGNGVLGILLTIIRESVRAVYRTSK